MQKLKDKLIYIIAIVMLIGTLILVIKTFPEVKYPNKIGNNVKIENKRIDLGTLQKRKVTVTSRGENKSRIPYIEIEKENNDTDTKEDNKKEKSNKEVKKDTTKYTSINQVKISRTMDLTKRTGLSREDFIKLMSRVRQDTSGFFKNNAGTIYDLCKKYNINEIFFCGLISAESGWNIAPNHRRTHNYISLMKNGKLIRFGSVKSGLEAAAQKLHYNYLTPGGKFYKGKTLSAVKTRFCPASSTWVSLVYGRMQQII
ncbi:MAG: hypothetical protein HFJ17_06260 [Clostridia bacterium]|nr:hypothetical protein [Clostridia bacterium]